MMGKTKSISQKCAQNMLSLRQNEPPATGVKKCVKIKVGKNNIKLFEYSLSDKMKGTVFNKVSK